MALTVADIINIAKVSEYLSAIDVEKGSLYSPRIIPETPQILYNERKAVEYWYNLDPADTSLIETSNYLYSLCRGYNLQAQQISGTAGTIAPVNPTAIPTPYDFIVSSTSLIPTGGTTLTISPYIGFNLLFVRNGIPQSTVNVGQSYYSWDKTIGLLTIYPAAYEGEQFQLYPV